MYSLKTSRSNSIRLGREGVYEKLYVAHRLQKRHNSKLHLVQYMQRIRKRHSKQDCKRRKNKKKSNKKESDENMLAVSTDTSYELAKLFQKYNIDAAFKTRKIVERILQNNTNAEDPLDKQGVYKWT